jgi:hypothetical protein
MKKQNTNWNGFVNLNKAIVTWTPPLACELKIPTSPFLPSLCEVCLLIHIRGQFSFLYFSFVKKFEASGN